MCDNEIIDLKYCKKSYTVLDLDHNVRPVGLSRNLLRYIYIVKQPRSKTIARKPE